MSRQCLDYTCDHLSKPIMNHVFIFLGVCDAFIFKKLSPGKLSAQRILGIKTVSGCNGTDMCALWLFSAGLAVETETSHHLKELKQRYGQIFFNLRLDFNICQIFLGFTEMSLFPLNYQETVLTLECSSKLKKLLRLSMVFISFPCSILKFTDIQKSLSDMILIFKRCFIL